MRSESCEGSRGRGPCGSEIGEKLTAFFDGELEGEDADEVAAHIESCAPCRERMDSLERIDAPLRALEPPAVEAGEWKKCWGVIEAAIATEARPAPRVDEVAVARARKEEAAAVAARRMVRILLPVAAAALVAVTGYGYRLAGVHDDTHRHRLEHERALVGGAPDYDGGGPARLAYLDEPAEDE